MTIIVIIISVVAVVIAIIIIILTCMLVFSVVVIVTNLYEFVSSKGSTELALRRYPAPPCNLLHNRNQILIRWDREWRGANHA